MSSFGRAFNQVATADFAMTVGLIIVGGIAARLLTDWARNNVIDIGIRGGDALYGTVGAVASMAFLPRNIGRPLALGMMAAAGQTAAQEFGVL